MGRTDHIRGVLGGIWGGRKGGVVYRGAWSKIAEMGGASWGGGSTTEKVNKMNFKNKEVTSAPDWQGGGTVTTKQS